jgi:hypothetical protein
MVVVIFSFSAKTRQSLVNQAIRHSRIIRYPLRQAGVARQHAARLPPQQNARGNSRLNPTRIASHILNPFDH